MLYAKITWWLLLSLLPWEIHKEAANLSSYKCLHPGDCYIIAALVREGLELLFKVSALLIWPDSAWSIYSLLRKNLSDGFY